MSMKQLFYAALTARIISWLSLGLAFFCVLADLDLKTAVLSLAVSHMAWMLGTMFLGVFREHMVEIASKIMSEAIEVATEEEPVDPKEITSHPIFDEEETND